MNDNSSFRINWLDFSAVHLILSKRFPDSVTGSKSAELPSSSVQKSSSVCWIENRRLHSHLCRFRKSRTFGRFAYHIEIWLKGRDGRNLSFFYPWKKRLVHFKHFLLYINTRIRFHHDLNYGVSILCKLHINFVVLFLLLIKTVLCFWLKMIWKSMRRIGMS